MRNESASVTRYKNRHWIIIPFLLLIISSFQVNGQGCDFASVLNEKIESKHNKIESKYIVFNEVVKHFKLKDTIQYRVEEGKVKFTYQGEEFESINYNHKLCGEAIMLDFLYFEYGGKGFKFKASIPLENGMSQAYELIIPEKQPKTVIFKDYKEDGIQPAGKFIQRNCEGKITVQGNYKLVDFPNTFEFRYMDQKRKVHDAIVSSDQKSVKTGKWKYYHENGLLLHEENYKEDQFSTTKKMKSLCNPTDKSLFNYYKLRGQLPNSILYFNALQSAIGKDLVMTLDFNHREIVYYLNGKQIPEPFINGEFKKMPWEQQKVKHANALLLEKGKSSFRMYTPYSEENGMEFKVTLSKDGIQNVKTFETTNYRPNGKYREFDCSNETIADGNYKTIDTLIVSREKSFDKNTYEEKMIETSTDHLTVRSGLWQFYENNKVIVEENYPGDRVDYSSDDLLCNCKGKKAEKNYYTYHKNYLSVFNEIASVHELQDWLSMDQNFGKHYYFKGQIVPTPKDVSKKNMAGDYLFTFSNKSIEINSNTRMPSLLKPDSYTWKMSYKVLFSEDNKLSRELHLYNNKSTLKDYQDGAESGKYEKRRCDGQSEIIGQHCQKDTVQHTIVQSFIDIETYEEKIVVTETNKTLKKIGKWMFFDDKGALINKKEYGTCNE